MASDEASKQIGSLNGILNWCVRSRTREVPTD